VTRILILQHNKSLHGLGKNLSLLLLMIIETIVKYFSLFP